MGQDDRSDLATALRELRREGGWTAAVIARKAGMSTAKLSKIENARVLPSLADVERLLTALQSPQGVRSRLLELARASVTEQRAWRVYQRLGFHKKQKEIAALENQARQLTLFQPAMMPGLLQSAEYIRSIFADRGDLSDDEQLLTVAERVNRQNILYEPQKNFRFIITESALAWRRISEYAMAVQIDRLVSIAAMPNVHLAVLPLAGLKPDFPVSVFCVFDDRLVTVETFHAEVSSRDPKDIEIYLETFQKFSDSALHGEEAMRFLRSRAQRLRGLG